MRHVIPSKGNEPQNDAVRETLNANKGRLVSSRLLDDLNRDLDAAREVDIAVAFILKSGWQRIHPGAPLGPPHPGQGQRPAATAR